MAIVEYARNVVGLKEVILQKLNLKKTKIAEIMEEQKKKNLGGTMRLGETEVKFAKDSKIAKIYGCLKIGERHRHRFEMNNEYIASLEKKGMVFSGFFAGSSVGYSADSSVGYSVGSSVGSSAGSSAGSFGATKTSSLQLVEAMELPKHPWFVAVQYHPEFHSTPFNPHPLFSSFIKASAQKS